MSSNKQKQQVLTAEDKRTQYLFKLLCQERMEDAVRGLVEISHVKAWHYITPFDLYGPDIFKWIREAFEEDVAYNYFFDDQ